MPKSGLYPVYCLATVEVLTMFVFDCLFCKIVKTCRTLNILDWTKQTNTYTTAYYTYIHAQYLRYCKNSCLLCCFYKHLQPLVIHANTFKNIIHDCNREVNGCYNGQKIKKRSISCALRTLSYNNDASK